MTTGAFVRCAHTVVFFPYSAALDLSTSIFCAPSELQRAGQSVAARERGAAGGTVAERAPARHLAGPRTALRPLCAKQAHLRRVGVCALEPLCKLLALLDCRPCHKQAPARESAGPGSQGCPLACPTTRCGKGSGAGARLRATTRGAEPVCLGRGRISSETASWRCTPRPCSSTRIALSRISDGEWLSAASERRGGVAGGG